MQELTLLHYLANDQWAWGPQNMATIKLLKVFLYYFNVDIANSEAV